MRICRFTHEGRTGLCVVEQDEVVDLGAEVVPDLGALMVSSVRWREAVEERAGRTAVRLPLDAVELEAPIVRTPKFLGIGLNYADHIAETGADSPSSPAARPSTRWRCSTASLPICLVLRA